MLSRNNSRENNDSKAKSFLKPTISSVASSRYNKPKETYTTYINSRIVAGKTKTSDEKKEPKKAKQNHKLSYVPKKPGFSSNTRNNNHFQSKTNKNFYGLPRYGSISYNSSVSSIRDAMTSQRGNRNHSKSKLNPESSLENHTYSTFMKDRRSLGDPKHTFHHNSHSTLPNYSSQLPRSKERKTKPVVSSFAGIETISFNLSSKVKMLQTGNFY